MNSHLGCFFCGANLKEKDIKGNTALILAAKFGHDDIVRLILMNGADANVKDSDGKTCLMYATENDHQDIMKVLYQYGADVEADDRIMRKFHLDGLSFR